MKHNLINQKIQTADGQTLVLNGTVEAVEKKRSLTPEMGQEYWCIFNDGGKSSTRWAGNQYDLARLAVGNVYLTAADCDREIERLKARQRIRTFIAEECDAVEWWIDNQRIQFPVGIDEHGQVLMGEVTNLELHYGDQFYVLLHDYKKLVTNCEADLRCWFGADSGEK